MSVISKVRKLITTPSYTLGRFRVVRSGYSAARGLFDPQSQTSLLSESVYYQKVDVAATVKTIRLDSYAMLPVMAPDVVWQIHEFAKTELLKGQLDLGQFHYRDIHEGRLPDGRPVALAHVIDPGRSPVVAALRDDPILSSIARKYLGYNPRRLDVNLYWSFHVQMTESERRGQNQTIDYHFDVHDFNFSYYHMYVTDTHTANGAHALVRGSHIRKPFRWLFGSARQTDENIANYYPSKDIITLEGPGGTAFFEDTSCYHKAIPPRAGERLLLQIRYH